MRARMQGDSFWREISVPADARTYASLCDLTREAFRLSREAELSIVKNEDILLERDSDVSRLRMGDKLEVAVIGNNANVDANANTPDQDSVSVGLLSRAASSSNSTDENVL